MGKFAHLNRVAKMFNIETGREYLQDYVDIHTALGMAFTRGTASVVVPLDAQKDHEFIIIGKEPNDDWLSLYFDVYRTLFEQLGVFCWSSGAGWPEISAHGQRLKEQFRLNAAVARICTRGNCQSLANDVSSLEMYTFNSINTDTIQTLRGLQRRLASVENGPVL